MHNLDIGTEVFELLTSREARHLEKESLLLILKGLSKLGDMGSNAIKVVVGKSEATVEEQSQGEISIEELNKSYDQKEMIEVHNDDIDELRAELHQFKVDFAVIENKADETVNLVFKAKDTAILNKAIKKVAEKYGHKDRMESQMKHAEEKAQQQEKERSQDKNRDFNRSKERGMEH